MRLSGILFVVIMVMGGIGYWYYTDTQKTISVLTENNAKLNVAVQTNEATIKQMAEDFQKASQELNRVNEEFSAIRRQNQVLGDKLAKHDLGVLGSSKPGLVERIINNASAKAGRCFELLAGAQLTEAEKNAKDGKAFNSECPWLFDTLVVPNRVLDNTTAN
jgi:cell division protein FtsB